MQARSRTQRMICLTGMVALSLAAMAAPVLAAPADDIKTMLDRGQAVEAYRFGKARPDQLGSPVFDFFFGIAAIDAGHPGEGVLALERYLLNFPDNRSARFQLARGYFVVGEDQRARDEFEALLPGAQGAEKATIERYIDTIRARESRYQPTASAWLEGGTGHDSNVNSGIGGTQISIGGIPVTINPTSTAIKAQDAFFTLAGGVQGNYPVAPGVALFGNVALDTRHHGRVENSIFNTGNIGGQAGISVLDDRNLYRAFAGQGLLFTDNQRFLTQNSMGADYQHQFDDANRLNLGVGFARLDYTNTMVLTTRAQRTPTLSVNTVRNSDLTTIGGSWTHAIRHAMQPTLFVGLNLASENNRGHDAAGRSNSTVLRAQHSRDVASLRASLSFVPMKGWGASVGYLRQDSRYEGPWAGAPQNRIDHLDAIDASLAYFIDRNTSLRGELLLARQESPGTPLFGYERNSIALKLRYDFK